MAGIAPALPLSDFDRYQVWRQAGYAGEMSYLTDRRGDLRADPRSLLPNARSILCVGKLYKTNSEAPRSPNRGVISRYAQGEDYHLALRARLEQVVARLQGCQPEPFDWKICVDTAPLLERSYAQEAGLGWIGRNTCLINQQSGSWFLLAELLLSLDVQADAPPPDRCGSCTRCIDACPTAALLPQPSGGSLLDSRRCISYLTIEKRGAVDETLWPPIGQHIFGCDICQEVCPWNRRSPVTGDLAFFNLPASVDLIKMADLTPEEFRRQFARTPLYRAKYSGFLRNVSIALGNSRNPEHLQPLLSLSNHSDSLVAQTAFASLARLRSSLNYPESDDSESFSPT